MDNKPIMIDGVDVAGCDFLAKEDDYCSYSGEYRAYKGECGCSDGEMCKDYPNCFYKKALKQLARKTQECEVLKREIAFGNNGTLADEIRAEVFKELNTENDQLKAENEKLKKKKEENETFYLKKYANKDSECLELEHKLKQAEQKLERIREKVQAYIDDEADLTPEQVLQIIDEVEK